ncbi:MAG: ATP-binding protein [Clostridiales Family XIII bacterium]|jgi:predicted AAA+ superfamily ATPase|nr:ATP-binding protein [Clostridiales Family XIII bacterium]
MNTKRYIDQLILFDNFRRDEIAGLITGVTQDASNDVIEDAIVESYYSIQRRLIKGVGHGSITGTYLQNYFCSVLAAEENAFALMAEHGYFDGMKPGPEAKQSLKQLTPTQNALFLHASKELKLIRTIYDFNYEKVTGVVDGRNVAAFGALVDGVKGPGHLEAIHLAMRKKDCVDTAIGLAQFYRNYGCGVFSSSPAFELTDEKGVFAPVRMASPVLLEDLVGVDLQTQRLVKNTEILLAGLPANNVLLYGDSGTGKSSSVKGLIARYGAKGLKMISIRKEQLERLPEVMHAIEGRGMKFILFIDDISFEESESGYKIFKSMIEGSLFAKPENAIFMATSNRKNIVKEVWSDRQGSDDVRLRDNIQEKRSLSERFGITLIYGAPDKQGYLDIVRSLAAKAGLTMPDDELTEAALQWEIRHGGRSGRVARQFVDYMAGIARIESAAQAPAAQPEEGD